jgi:signal transduction histidine kinase
MTTLRQRIALSAVVISILAALIAAFVPELLVRMRDELFLNSLAASDRAALTGLLETLGKCAPQVGAFKLERGFANWRLNYEWALALLIALTALGGGWFALLLAGRIAAPIEALAASARAIAAGGRESPPPPPRDAPREIEALHRDFSAMTDALKAADDDVRLRSAAIAHELRTPLSVLRGRLIGVQSGVFDADDRLLSGLLRQVGLIDQLVADLNLLASARGVAMTLDRRPVALGELAAAVLDALQPDAASASVTLRMESNPVEVDVDPARIERAITNLVANAIRYAPGSTVTLSVRRSGEHAVVRVEDDGPGWPVENPQALMEAFVRGETSRSRDTGGAGLGLAIVDAVARAHGGSLKLSRAVRRGAVAELFLPLL